MWHTSNPGCDLRGGSEAKSSIIGKPHQDKAGTWELISQHESPWWGNYCSRTDDASCKMPCLQLCCLNPISAPCECYVSLLERKLPSRETEETCKYLQGWKAASACWWLMQGDRPAYLCLFITSSLLPVSWCCSQCIPNASWCQLKSLKILLSTLRVFSFSKYVLK